MAPGRHLVLDQGGQSSRAILYQDSGAPHHHAARGVATVRPAPGHVEQDPEAVVDSLRACIDEVLADGAGALHAGLAVQRSSVVCWRRGTGAALTPVLSWQDTRAHALFDELAIGPDAVRRITGLPPSAHYGATKLAWCLRNVDAVRRAHADDDLCVGPLASFLLYRLLDGSPYVATHTLAQRTLLFDVHARDWSQPLLDAFGLPRALLPAAVADRAPLGRLRGSGIPVTVCVGDQNGVPFAWGPPDAATVYVNAGTGAFVLRPLDAGERTPDGLLRSLLPGGDAAAEGTVNGAGGAVAWFEARAGAGFPWDGLNALDTPPFDAPLFVNAVGDLGSPFWRTGVDARFVPDAGTQVQRAYAVVESIAFLVRANVEGMRAAGLRMRRVRIAGGVAASDIVCTTLAAALDMPVARSGDLEATARGVLALMGGPADDAEPTVFAPDAAWVGALHRRYAVWRTLLDR